MLDLWVDMTREDDEVSRHGAYRLILGTGRLDPAVTLQVVALAKERHRRLGSRDRLAGVLDPLVDLPEELLVPGSGVGVHPVRLDRFVSGAKDSLVSCQ